MVGTSGKVGVRKRWKVGLGGATSSEQRAVKPGPCAGGSQSQVERANCLFRHHYDRESRCQSFFRRLLGLLAAVICLVAIAVSACGGDSSPSQRGDFLVGYRLHLEAVLAARAVVVATSNQRLAAYNSAPTRPLTASDLVVDEVDSLLNRVRKELPVPPDEPLRSSDAAWRSGIVRWFRAEQALASEDSQKNRDAEQQAMDEEHGAVRALTKYVTGSMTAPSTTTSIAAAPTTTKTDTLKVDEAKFTAVWRALMKIEGATSVGVVYNDMRNLVQDFATEISLPAPGHE